MKKQIAKRQREILQHISEGLTCKEVGIKLGISKRTVDAQMNNMYNITGANNAPHLVKLSIISGDIKLDDSVVKRMHKKVELTKGFEVDIEEHLESNEPLLAKALNDKLK